MRYRFWTRLLLLTAATVSIAAAAQGLSPDLAPIIDSSRPLDLESDLQEAAERRRSQPPAGPAAGTTRSGPADGEVRVQAVKPGQDTGTGAALPIDQLAPFQPPRLYESDGGDGPSMTQGVEQRERELGASRAGFAGFGEERDPVGQEERLRDIPGAQAARDKMIQGTLRQRLAKKRPPPAALRFP